MGKCTGKYTFRPLFLHPQNTLNSWENALSDPLSITTKTLQIHEKMHFQTPFLTPPYSLKLPHIRFQIIAKTNVIYSLCEPQRQQSENESERGCLYLL